MIKKEITVENPLGLHARPSALLCQIAQQYRADLSITKDDISVNGKSILGVLSLAAEQGSRLELEIEGPDEENLLKDLMGIFSSNFEDAYI